MNGRVARKIRKKVYRNSEDFRNRKYGQFKTGQIINIGETPKSISDRRVYQKLKKAYYRTNEESNSLGGRIFPKGRNRERSMGKD